MVCNSLERPLYRKGLALELVAVIVRGPGCLCRLVHSLPAPKVVVQFHSSKQTIALSKSLVVPTIQYISCGPSLF